MRKIITFLGKYPKQTLYRHAGKCYQGEVFAQALYQFCDFEQMLVCVTEEAKTTTWKILEGLNDPRILAVDIALGRTDAEMWQMFQTIVQHIDQGDTVIFDITHGLRSLPFLVFLFAAYLKAAKSATIEAIYYGAFELGVQNEPAPVIDLSSFVEMLDWLTATSRFTETGDGQELATLLLARISRAQDSEPSQEGNALRECAIAIETISRALGATRPLEVIEAAAGLKQVLSRAAGEIEQTAKPFALLSDRVLREYGQFALVEVPLNQRRIVSLQKQFQMIEWYIKRQQLVQAATLAREWMISVLIVYFNQRTIDRYEVDLALGCALKIRAGGTPRYPRNRSSKQKVEQITEKLGDHEGVVELWKQMGKLRNDIAHCGMGKAPATVIALEAEMKRVYKRLNLEVLVLLK